MSVVERQEGKQDKELTGYPSIDKPWLKYYSEEAVNAPYPECTVYEYVYQHNKDYLNQTALEYFGAKISFKKLFDQVDLCARALRANGVKQGSIVSICASAIPEITYLILACSKIGAVANFINPFFETQQKSDRINDTGSDTLFVMDKMTSYMKDVIGESCLKKIVIIPAVNSLPLAIRMLAGLKEKSDKDVENAFGDEECVSWNNYIKSARSYHGSVEARYEQDMPLAMVYSSGTTGASKGIVLTNAGTLSTMRQYEMTLPVEEKRGNRFLCNVPVWLATGIVVSMLTPLCLEAVCILEPVFSPEPFLRDIIQYKPNYALVTTSLWIYIANHLPKDFDLSFLKHPITGGEQLLSSTEIFLNEFLKSHNCNAELQKGWGMCELGATAATTSCCGGANRLGSVGIPMPLAVISAFDVDNGRELKYNKRGEIRVQTPSRMKEYYNNPAATKDFFHADANGNIWACTGDIGYVDENGFVFILGRANDYFISPDGRRQYLFDAENVILENKFVDLCEVISRESEKLGRKVPLAHIIVKKDFDGDINTLICDIDRNCRKKLSEYAVPAGYKIREEFVIKESGKRDTLLLEKERDGFIRVENGKVQQADI